MTIRAVSALLSGWRRNRQASSASKRGMVQVPDPNSVTSPVASGLTGPLACHQVATAATIAAHSAVRPAPSRRWSGSRSRALRPRARETVPTVWASAIQIAATALTTQPARITNGLVEGAGRVLRRPVDLPRLLGRLRLVLYAAPRRLRAAEPDPRRVELAGCRDRLVVPPRGRAAPLGARVAMIPNRNERRADSIATPAACREVPVRSLSRPVAASH